MKSSPSGRLLPTAKGYTAFIPNQLPPELEWSSRLLKALSRADHALGQLSREGARLPNPHVLIRPFVTREAVLSSKIEGTQATIGDVLARDAEADPNLASGDLLEIQNYMAALDHGIHLLGELPLSVRIIKEIHSKLMQGVRGAHATPGEFRRSQNWIGPPGSTLSTARYVPPPVEEMLNCLSDLERFFHDAQFPTLIQIALCHYQFEAIHPFLDGNGRVGRLLIVLMLIEKELLPSPLLYLSAFFEATRSDYYEYLHAVSTSGAWEEWCIYFLNGVANQSEDVVSRVERINSLLEGWQAEIGGGRSKVLIELLRGLAGNPFLSAARSAANLGIAYTTAQRSIKKLESLGIIQEITEGKRDRVYCALQIFRILDEPVNIHTHTQTG